MNDNYYPRKRKQESGSTGFQPVPNGELLKKRRNLPHWERGGATYFITFRTKCVNLSPTVRRLVLDACLYGTGAKYRLWAAVIMPDHVHLLLTPREVSQGEWHALSAIIHSLKSYTAQEVNRRLGRKGPLWQDDYFNRIVRDEAEFLEKWNYIRNNPVTKELCDRPDEWEAFYEYQGPCVW